jgi:hypothetical protein
MALAHAGLEHLVASLTPTFGSVHRKVRVPREICRLLLSGAVEDDPGAGRSEYLLFFEGKGKLQYLRHPPRYPCSLTYASNALNQDRELVPAESRCGVFGARKPSDAQRPLWAADPLLRDPDCRS